MDSVLKVANQFSADAKISRTDTMALPTSGGCPRVTPAANIDWWHTFDVIISEIQTEFYGTDSYGFP
jgi:hypothetical protein